MTVSSDVASSGFSSQQLEEIRDRFAEAWRERRRISIESLLETIPTAAREEAFLELLMDELTLRIASDEKFSIEEYMARFPGREELVEWAFRDIAQDDAGEVGGPAEGADAAACPRTHDRAGWGNTPEVSVAGAGGNPITEPLVEVPWRNGDDEYETPLLNPPPRDASGSSRRRLAGGAETGDADADVDEDAEKVEVRPERPARLSATCPPPTLTAAELEFGAFDPQGSLAGFPAREFEAREVEAGERVAKGRNARGFEAAAGTPAGTSTAGSEGSVAGAPDAGGQAGSRPALPEAGRAGVGDRKLPSTLAAGRVVLAVTQRAEPVGDPRPSPCPQPEGPTRAGGSLGDPAQREPAQRSQVERGQAAGGQAAGQAADRGGRGGRSPGHPAEAMPESIGGFRVIRRLGEGGFGAVYLAEDPWLRRLVAIKVPNARAREQLRDDWLKEAQIVAQLDHPHIVPVHTVGSVEGFPAFIVSKYIDGCTLAERLKQSPIPLAEVVDLVIDVAEALDYAHRPPAGVIHRDITPRNLLLDQHGRIYVSDFGLAIRETELTADMAIGGTPPYMSPEQILGEGHRMDGQSDVFSLGVVLYELLTGERPFRGKDFWEIREAVTRRDPRPPRQTNAGVSLELERICLKALAKLCSERYQTAAEFAADLRQLRASERPGGMALALLEVATPLTPPGPGGAPAVGAGGATPPGGAAGGGNSSNRSPGPPQPPTTGSGASSSGGAASSATLRIVPKGLRAFDASDAGFFLELLPGPRDREQLPESIRFWKQRIEGTGGAATFPVGLLCGASGSGKSSLVKAGLLPRLAASVLPLYLETTADGTEARLLALLHQHLPRLQRIQELPQALAAVRRGEAGLGRRKLLLVLDQFEQWLQAHVGAAGELLQQALRQCDGERLQALVLVRDDYSLGFLQFSRQIEVPLRQAENSATVELFSMSHARQVLTAFGRALGQLPAGPAELSGAEQEFVERAVAGLAEQQQVVPVRLALFAEMFRQRPWTPEGLRAVGGAEGVGRAFLEATLGSDRAPPQYRVHAAAAARVLEALLPEVGSELRGHRRSRRELVAAAGYANRPDDAAELIHILDAELHLISPVLTWTGGMEGIADDARPGGAEVGGEVTDASRPGPALMGVADEVAYHLTHDSLVPSLRRWLEDQLGGTAEGRAKLLLRERSRLWNDRPTNRHLPTLSEHLRIRRWTRGAERTEPEQRMLARTAAVHARQAGLVLLLLAVLAGGGWWLGSLLESRRLNATVLTLLDQLPHTKPEDWNRSIAALRDPRARPLITQALAARPEGAGSEVSSRSAVTALVRLLALGEDESLDSLREELLAGEAEAFLPLRELLQPHASRLIPQLWQELRDSAADPRRRLRAAMALAGLETGAGGLESPRKEESPDANAWTEADVDFVAEQLLCSNPEAQPVIREALRPIRKWLIPAIDPWLDDARATDRQRLGAANALGDYARDQPLSLVGALSRATPEQYQILFSPLAATASKPVLDELTKIAGTPARATLAAEARVQHAGQRAGAAATLLRLRQHERALLAFDSSPDPEALMQFIFRCRPRDVAAEELLVGLDMVAKAPPGKYPAQIRYALLLALGEFASESLPDTQRGPLLRQLEDWYANDPSSAIHAASGWLLRHWKRPDITDRIDAQPRSYEPGREWFNQVIDVEPRVHPLQVQRGNPRRQRIALTFVVYPAGRYQIGAHADPEATRRGETRHQVVMTRPFAVADREITFREMILCAPHFEEFMAQHKAHPGDAAFAVTWYDAVTFLRWLGTEAGLLEGQQPYVSPEALPPGLPPRDGTPGWDWAPRNWPFDVSKPGYRLPTEAEWEIAAQAGTVSAFAFGDDRELLPAFGWFAGNAGDRVHGVRELRPNLRGLFDIHGNLSEWVHDWHEDFRPDPQTSPVGPRMGLARVLRGGSWNDAAGDCRTFFRSGDGPTSRSTLHGFRPAMTLPQYHPVMTARLIPSGGEIP